MTRIKLRGDTADDWNTKNPILASREVGLETDTGFLKFGDGSTAWLQLAYASSSIPDASVWAMLDSPVFTGDPQVPNPGANDYDNTVASTKWVVDKIIALLATGTGAGVPVNAALPSVTLAGTTATVNVGQWSGTPTSFTYQWQRSVNSNGSSASNISGATSASYTVQGADINDFLVCLVTAINGTGSSAQTASKPSTQVQGTTAAPSNSVLPVVSGSTVVGQTLTATNGTWTGSPTFTYQWSSRLPTDPVGQPGTRITGATSSTYVLTSGELGRQLYVIVTATNAGGTNTAYSSSTATIAASGGTGTLMWAPTFTIGNQPIKGTSSEFATTGSNTTSNSGGSTVTCVADPLGSGTAVYKFAVANADRPSTGHPRADLLSGTGIADGSSIFMSIPFYLPVGVGGVNTGIPVFGGGGTNFCQYAEVKDTVGGPPWWGLYIQGVAGVQSYVLRNGSTGAVYWSTPVTNAWHTAILSGVWSRTQPPAFFNMWWDGNPVTFSAPTVSTRIDVKTLGSSGPQVGSGNQPLDINSYRAADYYTGTLTTYHGRPKIGTTFASVANDSGLPQGP